MSFSDTSSSWLQTFRKLFELAYGDQIVLEYESCRVRGTAMVPPGQTEGGRSGRSASKTG